LPGAAATGVTTGSASAETSWASAVSAVLSPQAWLRPQAPSASLSAPQAPSALSVVATSSAAGADSLEQPPRAQAPSLSDELVVATVVAVVVGASDPLKTHEEQSPIMRLYPATPMTARPATVAMMLTLPEPLRWNMLLPPSAA